jgi:hypothetical protein
MGIYGNLVSTRTNDMPFPQGFGDQSRGVKASGEIDCNPPNGPSHAHMRKSLFQRVGLGPDSRVVMLCRQFLPQPHDA